MQQSVTELLQLVGSGGQVAAAPPAAAPRYEAVVQRITPVAPKHNAGGIITWNEAKMANGRADGSNGAAHRRNEIPLGDGFKDF
jgi:hypothetical protein